jgi:transposase-like protein
VPNTTPLAVTDQSQSTIFVRVHGDKYPKAVAKLVKDRDVLLTFYDFPAAHWVHLRTTNPIESTSPP